MLHERRCKEKKTQRLRKGCKNRKEEQEELLLLLHTNLAHARHPGNEQLAEKLVLHRHLGEEVVDLIVLAVPSVPTVSDHVGKNKTGLCEISRKNTPEGTVARTEERRRPPPRLNPPLSQDVEYSVLSRDCEGEYLEMIGSLPKKL